MLGFGLRLTQHRVIGYDPDSRAFFAHAGVIDNSVRQRHDRTVRWLKREDLWGSLGVWMEHDAGAMNDSADMIPAEENETVTLWLNRRSATGNLSQGTANRMPVLKSGGVYANGTSEMVGDAAYKAAINSTEGYTIVLGVNSDGASAIGRILHYHHDLGAAICQIHAAATQRWGVWARRVQTDGSTEWTSPNGGLPTGVHTAIAVRVVATAATIEFFANGVPLNMLSLVSPGNMTNGIYGGLFSLNGGLPYTGYLKGFFIFRSALTNSQISHLSQHLI